MKSEALNLLFKEHFDVVGIIQTKRYLDESKKMNKVVLQEIYPTMVVVGLSYPYRVLKHTNTHLVSSFYTFGSDYHTVLKQRIERVMRKLDVSYTYGVDNHPHQERLAAVLAGVGFFGKNQLIINPTLGSYFFLGLVFIDIKIEDEFILEITDDCGTCRKCIDACPTHALDDNYYDVNKCISNFNQAKRVLNQSEMKANYTLFGCDICQMVCPKNINKGKIVHSEFDLSGKEMVSIVDLFTDSEKEFKAKYDGMSYLWKGKTILMRNASMLLLKHKNTNYIPLIESSLDKHQMPWYKDTVSFIVNELKEIKKES